MSSQKPEGKQTGRLIVMFKQPGVVGESRVSDGIGTIFNLPGRVLQCHYQHLRGGVRAVPGARPPCQTLSVHHKCTRRRRKQLNMMSKHLQTRRVLPGQHPGPTARSLLVALFSITGWEKR